MKLRPIPDLENIAAMAKLGRLSAIRSAKLDAFASLRDVAAKLMRGDSPDELKDIADARTVLDRIEELNRLEAPWVDLIRVTE